MVPVLSSKPTKPLPHKTINTLIIFEQKSGVVRLPTTLQENIRKSVDQKISGQRQNDHSVRDTLLSIYH